MLGLQIDFLYRFLALKVLKFTFLGFLHKKLVIHFISC